MYIYLAILLAGLLSGGGVAWKIQGWRHDSQDKARIEQAREDKTMREKSIDTAAVKHERAKERIRTEFITITETVEKIVKEPFYLASNAPACLDDRGLLELTQAINGVPATPSKPAPAVR